MFALSYFSNAKTFSLKNILRFVKTIPLPSVQPIYLSRRLGLIVYHFPTEIAKEDIPDWALYFMEEEDEEDEEDDDDDEGLWKN